MKKLILIISLFPLFTFSQVINKTLYFDGLNREYIVYIPINYNNTVKVPLLFSFHGGGGYASDHMQMTNFNTIADTAGFIAIYPQGALDVDGADPGSQPSTSWLHKAPTTHNDVNFIAAIIDDLQSEYLVDEDRVYACGYSEGGIFSYELGCRLNDRIAAFASVSGSMLTDSFRSDYGFGVCSPMHPTAVLLIPGTNDMNYHSIYTGFQPYYLSVDDITNYWSNYNNTDTNPIVTPLADISPSDGSTVEKNQWFNGDNCVSILELKVNGGDHEWPGSFGNMDIDASAEIWNFVSKYDINGLINCSSTHNIFVENFNSNKIVKIFDILGKETKEKRSELLFYINQDGEISKKIIF